MDAMEETGACDMAWRMEAVPKRGRHWEAHALIIATNTLQTIYKSQDVVQVNLPAESGEMGVLANHVPSIEQLKPGLIEIVEESGGSKQFFRTLAPRTS